MGVRAWIGVALLVAGLWPHTADCGDGLLEISQACAEQTGCFPGDAPGLPVTISQAGSYQLTGDLMVPDLSTDGIQISVSFVQIDLSGFSVLGPGSCSFAACPTGTGRGVGQVGSPAQVTVRNGYVRGVGSHGVEINSGAVEQVTVAGVGGDGIVLGSGLVRGKRISGVGGAGLQLASEFASYSDNWIGLKALARASASIVGGSDAGGNVCIDRSCDPRGLRRYYLTPTTPPANTARTACAAGFHMASLYELVQPSALQYDTGLGVTSDDSGSGPPIVVSTDFAFGWVRGGANATGGAQAAGVANCNNWSTTSAGTTGSVANIWGDWTNQAPPPLANSEVVWPWWVVALPCNSPARVWCVQD